MFVTIKYRGWFIHCTESSKYWQTEMKVVATNGKGTRKICVSVHAAKVWISKQIAANVGK